MKIFIHLINIIIIYLLCAYFFGWSPFQKYWTAYVYEDIYEINAQEQGPYKNLEDCRVAALKTLDERSWVNGHFSCGLNCQNDPGTDLNICAETVTSDDES